MSNLRLDHPLVDTLSARAAFMLGRVVAAYDTRTFYRSFIKPAEKDVVDAAKSARSAPMVAEVSDFYDSLEREAQQSHAAARVNKRQSERYFKRLRYELVEAHPEAEAVLDALISEATKT